MLDQAERETGGGLTIEQRPVEALIPYARNAFSYP